MPFQPRYVPGKFRDCQWCHGKGCIACDAEAEKAYKRECPDGPQLAATIQNDASGVGAIKDVLTKILGQENIASGRASFVVASHDALASPTMQATLAAMRELGIPIQTLDELDPQGAEAKKE